MAYEEGIDDPCSPLMEIHSLSCLLHRKEAPLSCDDPSIPSPSCELTICQVPEFSKYTPI